MNQIVENYSAVLQQIRQAERDFQRPLGSVKLLAVSKAHDVHKIESISKAGQVCFGENYCQEAIAKIRSVKNTSLEWHFIGTLQANKTKLIAENFAWVQSINRWKIAERLNQHRPLNLPPLNVCIEVNISQERSKTGIEIHELHDLAIAIEKLPRLKLRGLMIIPEPSNDFKQQLQVYQKAYSLYQELINKGFLLDTLSMGMTNDFVAAIAAGSTMVRIGSAIFGPRAK